MTKGNENKTTRSSEPNKMLLTVHLSNGESKLHIIEVPQTAAESLDIIKFFAEIISAALGGESKYLYLIYPSVAYNTSHIVYIETDFKGPREWKEIIDKSYKEQIGFKSPRDVKK